MNADRLLALYEKVSDAPDAVPRLRRFVLKLAVRGKLVPQEAGDEPASDLLKRLAAEKARLVATGSLGRTKAAAPTVVREDLELPAGWTAVYGFDLFPTRSGNSKLVKGRQHSEPADGLYPGFSAAGQDVWLDRWEHEGDAIILSAVGARCGKAFRARGKWSAIANTHIIWLLPSVTDPSFAMLHLNNEDFWLRSGGAQPFVKVKATLERPFPLPPLAEQRRIVAKVEELMALLDRLEAARTAREATRDRLTAASLARLTAPDADPADFPANARFALATLPALTSRPDQIKPLRQTILNLAVRGKLVEQNPADDWKNQSALRPDKEAESYDRRAFEERAEKFDLPSNWTIEPLSRVAERIVDCPHTTPKWTEQGVLCIKTNQVRAGILDLSVPTFVSEETYKIRIERLEPLADDILYIREGGVLGVGCRIPPNTRLCMGQRLMLIRANASVAPVFLELCLNSPWIADFAVEKTTGGAAPRVNMSLVRGYPIPLPPLAEQYRIVAKVDAFMALCNRLEAALTTADTTRARLLEALLYEALEPSTDAATKADE